MADHQGKNVVNYIAFVLFYVALNLMANETGCCGWLESVALIHTI